MATTIIRISGNKAYAVPLSAAAAKGRLAGKRGRHQENETTRLDKPGAHPLSAGNQNALVVNSGAGRIFYGFREKIKNSTDNSGSFLPIIQNF